MGLEGCREGDGTMIDTIQALYAMLLEWLTLERFTILIGLYVLIRLVVAVGKANHHLRMIEMYLEDIRAGLNRD